MRVSLVILLLVGLETPAYAQIPPLPKLDSVSFFAQVGDFESGTLAGTRAYGPFKTFGWGFETAFTVVAKDDCLVELAVGYDQLFTRERLGSFIWSGEVRDLPSTTIYVSFPNNFYVGVATGITSLTHTSINDGTSRFAVSGDTFDAAVVIGYAFPLQARSLVDRRIGGFVEAAYHARYFGGLDYGPGAPASLPDRLYLGGFTVSVGIQLAIGAKAAITASK